MAVAAELGVLLGSPAFVDPGSWGVRGTEEKWERWDARTRCYEFAAVRAAQYEQLEQASWRHDIHENAEYYRGCKALYRRLALETKKGFAPPDELRLLMAHEKSLMYPSPIAGKQ